MMELEIFRSEKNKSLNPEHQVHKASQDNRSDQMNKNNPAYRSSRKR